MPPYLFLLQGNAINMQSISREENRRLGSLSARSLFTAPWAIIFIIAAGIYVVLQILSIPDQVLLVRSDEGRFTSISQFEDNMNLLVGIIPGSEGEAAVRREQDLLERIREFESSDMAVQALIAEEIDAVVVDSFSAPQIIEIFTDELHIFERPLRPNVFAVAFNYVREGIPMTLRIAFMAYFFAILIGLLIGLVRSNPPVAPKPGTRLSGFISAGIHTLVYNIATVYVTVLRGLPILVVLFIVAFVLVPAIRESLNNSLGLELAFRGTSPESVIFALALTYGAFLSETFRAGIQSIGKGQIEAARSLGMNYLQTVQHIILPQAVRRILPPLGNDLIAMIKDSSLATVLGVQDITQLAKEHSSASFRYLETYLIVALIYLTMTTIGSLLVRYIERKVKVDN
jgi:polar amino acid transport system permease protein